MNLPLPVETLNAWGAAWSGFMLRSLVDASVLLALVLAIWLPLRRRMSAQFAHGLFCLVLLKLIVPVTWPGWVPDVAVRQAAEHASALERFVASSRAEPGAGLPALAPVPAALDLPTTGDLGSSLAEALAREATGTGAPDIASVDPNPRAASAPAALSLPAVLMLGWAALAALLLARFLRSVLSTRRLVREALPLEPDGLPIDVEALRRSVGVRAPVRWAVSPRLVSPAVGGLLHPTVVLPPDLDDGLTPKQMTWVLLHELAHVRRGDLWVVVAERLAQAVFFFHPAVHVAGWIIDQLREYACDDVALAACETSRHDCGEGFLTIVGRTVEHAPAATPALGLFESRMLIRRRLLRILDKRRKVHERLSPAATFVLLTVGLIVLPYGRSRDASAHVPAVPAGPRVEARDVLDEPPSYRPGAAWYRTAGAGESARVVVLGLAYSPDGTRLATAGEDATVLIRESASGRVLVRLEGHSDAVACVRFAPDGKTVATAGYDRTVRLWETASGRAIATLEGHANWVFAVAFSPDGKTLASAGHDQSVRLWDAASGRALARLTGHTGSVRAVAFAPDGKTLASAGGDRTAILWDLATRAPRRTLQGHKGTIRSLAFAPDGASLATASEDGEVRLWDSADGRDRAVLSGHGDMVVCLAYSPQGGSLATGSLDTTVKLWDTRTGRERATLQGHTDGVSALAFAPDARQLATGGFDGSVRLWEPAAPVFSAAACLAYPGAPRTVAFSPDGRALIATGAAGVRRWDLRSGTPLAPPDQPSNAALPANPERAALSPDGKTRVTAEADGTFRVRDVATRAIRASWKALGCESLAFSPDGRLIASGHREGDIVLWEAKSGRTLGLLKGHRGAVSGVAFAPDGRSVGSSGADHTVKLWDLTTRRQTARATLQGDLGCVWSVAYAPDGRTLAVAEGPNDSPGTVTLWDVATRRLKATLEGHERAVFSVVYSPDGKTLASAGGDGSIRLWNAETGESRYELSGLGGVTELAFSPDGSLLASAGEGKFVTLWDVATGAEAGRLTGLDGRARCVAFAPDGRTLASGGGVIDNNNSTGPGAKGEVKLWDVATRTLGGSLEGHARAVLAVKFSPDGATLASGGLDATIRLWDVPTGRLRLARGGFPNCVQSLAFSTDGRLLAWSGRGDGLVSLLDPCTGSEAVRLVGHGAVVHGIAFAPDGRGLATGGSDKTIRLWDVPLTGPARKPDNAPIR